MARKNNSLANPFKDLQNKKENEVKLPFANSTKTQEFAPETEEEYETVDGDVNSINNVEDSVSSSVTEDVHEETIVNLPEKTEKKFKVEIEDSVEENYEDEPGDLQSLKNSLLGKYNDMRSKKTVEETHKRTTFLLRKDLAHRLDKLTKNKRGMKAMVLNEAVETILKALEGDQKD